MSNFYNVNSNVIGNFQISAQEASDSTQRHQSGLVVQGVSPYWGHGEFVYAKFGGTVAQYGLCVMTPTLTSGQLVPVMTHHGNTANTGMPVFVAMVSGVDGNWGWFMRRGVSPVNGTASVAAGTVIGITAAGQIGAVSNGKQVLNAKNILAATTTVAKTGCTARSGSYEINVPNSNGWFIGCYLSGTGVGSNAKISKISPDGRTVTVDVACSAAVNGTVTGTYNNSTIYYNVVELEGAFVQGQVA